ncbi:MAG TPA: hypothetical protein PKJ08_02495 [Candidatus Cloacimonadota bacterium]|jgi:hypothetical protein|nr:hypothetical protein [Candidatus Cloacimonadota bacterium]HOD53374.1 hypothetical protein [Candidatus Cloacimonadota bacterium]HPM01580.1 hypothetical protein [Candidatus Cloacimonadota bacterium]
MKNKDYSKVIKTLIILNLVMVIIVLLAYCAKTKDYSGYKVKNIIEFHRGIQKK